jgi:Protein of unknown function (DUF2628)
MARYVVMQNGNDSHGAEFIRDTFSLPALIVPHLWLLFHRQWLAAAAVTGIMVLGALAAWRLNAPLLMLAVDLPISIYVALEGACLRIFNLESKGWHEAGAVEADTLEEAEIRFFGALPQVPLAAEPIIAPALVLGRPSNTAFAFPQRG